MPRYVTNFALHADRLPTPDADWHTISRFAATFDATKYTGSRDAAAELAVSGSEETLSALRAMLSLHNLRVRERGTEPSADDIAYMRELIERIRSRVEAARRLLA
jgi:hypothetical protein